MGRVDEAVPHGSAAPRQQRGAEPEPPRSGDAALPWGKPSHEAKFLHHPETRKQVGETSGRDHKFSKSLINAPTTLIIPGAVI